MICCCQHVEGQQIVVDSEPSTRNGNGNKLLDEDPDYAPHDLEPVRHFSPSPPPLGESGLSAAADLAGLWDIVPSTTPLPDVVGTSLPVTLGLFDGGSKTVELSMRPLDLYFQKEPPFVVRGVRGHAADLGIAPGSVLKRVGGVDLRQKSDLQAMCHAVAELPLKIRMIVQSPDGGLSKTVFITSRPVGLEFRKVPPFSIEAVTPAGHAEKLGLRPGMCVKQVGTSELTEDTDVKEVLSLLALLPEL